MCRGSGSVKSHPPEWGTCTGSRWRRLRKASGSCRCAGKSPSRLSCREPRGLTLVGTLGSAFFYYYFYYYYIIIFIKKYIYIYINY